jgi:hypothetical protein
MRPATAQTPIGRPTSLIPRPFVRRRALTPGRHLPTNPPKPARPEPDGQSLGPAPALSPERAVCRLVRPSPTGAPAPGALGCPLITGLVSRYTKHHNTHPAQQAPPDANPRVACEPDSRDDTRSGVPSAPLRAHPEKAHLRKRPDLLFLGQRIPILLRIAFPRGTTLRPLGLARRQSTRDEWRTFRHFGLSKMA